MNRTTLAHVFDHLLPKKKYDMDPAITDYILSFLDEAAKSDLTTEALNEFMAPLLEDVGVDSTTINELCNRVHELAIKKYGAFEGDSNPDGAAGGNHENGLKRLETSVQMSDMKSALLNIEHGTTSPIASQDLAHVASRNARIPSSVDSERLKKQQEQQAKRAAKRGLNETVNRNWDRNPNLIVNQANSRLPVDGTKDIKIENFDISYGGKPILKNANLSLAYGRRYGLVGKNGIGKSTLLRAIASKELKIPEGIRFLHVEQEIQADDTPALQCVLSVDTERESLIQEEKRLAARLTKLTVNSEEFNKSSTRLNEVHMKLQEIEADKAESRASSILSGLGFPPILQKAAAKTFSGGWRMRLALARALFFKPDLLLADEVTNYLDMPSVVWLERYLCKLPGTLLVVSHDRSFLDGVATDIIHLHSMELHTYRGNFSQFVETRREKHKNQMKEYEAQMAQKEHLQSFIDRFRYNAKRAAQVQSRIKVLEKLEELKPPSKDEYEGLSLETGANAAFSFPDPDPISPPILQLDEITFAYPGTDRVILENVSLDLQMDSKCAIVGPNGAGKSTMVYVLTGKYPPIKGMVKRHGRLRIGLFSQHHVDALDLNLSSVEWLSKTYPGKLDEEYRRILGRFGITGMTALQPIGTLSGGQKSRVVFAGLACMAPHVLVLDEPTNHLDMDSIDMLSNSLKRFKGAVCIVSHDEKFLDSVATEVWVCEGGRLKRFEGKVGDNSGIVGQYKKSLKVDD